MNKTLFAAVAVVAIALAVVALQPFALRAAEDPAAQPDAQDEANTVGAVMRIDLGPVVTQIQALQKELSTMKKSMEDMQKAFVESQAKQADIAAAMNRLAPRRWDYKVLRTLNDSAVKAEGIDGWELVAITPQGWIFFRRPLLAVEEGGEVK
jgi:peptidoglycan hydrolase CwlO-like protein